MRGSIRYINNKPKKLIASAKWQDLRETVLGNPRKRTPEWVINFSWSHIPYSTGSEGSLNERMTRKQAQALVEVLTKALAVKDGEGGEFLVVGPIRPETRGLAATA